MHAYGGILTGQPSKTGYPYFLFLRPTLHWDGSSRGIPGNPPPPFPVAERPTAPHEGLGVFRVEQNPDSPLPPRFDEEPPVLLPPKVPIAVRGTERRPPPFAILRFCRLARDK
jgi:hypothetical protein